MVSGEMFLKSLGFVDFELRKINVHMPSFKIIEHVASGKEEVNGLRSNIH